MAYKIILFDADMTLFDFKTSESQCLEQTLLDFGFPHSPDVLSLYSCINDSFWKRFERGEIDRASLLTERFRELFREMGVSGDPAAFNHQYMENVGGSALLLDGAREICEELSKNYDLYIITNGSARNQRRRFEKAAFAPYFRDVFISEEMGCQKPQTAFFDHVAANVSGWDAAKVLVVGDSLSSDIQGAINYGLDSCWFNPEKLPYTLKKPCTYEISRLSQLPAILS